MRECGAVYSKLGFVKRIIGALQHFTHIRSVFILMTSIHTVERIPDSPEVDKSEIDGGLELNRLVLEARPCKL